MKRCAIAGLLLMSLLAGCSKNKPRSEELMFWDLPEPVQRSVGERFPRAKMERVERLTWKDGVSWYRLSFTYMGASRTILLTPEGQTPETTK